MLGRTVQFAALRTQRNWSVYRVMTSVNGALLRPVDCLSQALSFNFNWLCNQSILPDRMFHGYLSEIPKSVEM